MMDTTNIPVIQTGTVRASYHCDGSNIWIYEFLMHLRPSLEHVVFFFSLNFFSTFINYCSACGMGIENKALVENVTFGKRAYADRAKM